MQKKSKYTVAIAGVTGAVGVEFLTTLEKRNFPVGKLIALASARSAGKKIKFRGEEITIQEMTADSFNGVDIALFSAGGKQSKEFGPIAAKAGAVVIDNSSAFRMDPNVPLVVPEINPEDAFKHNGIIANPNCTTIIMGVGVFPIHQINPIQKIVVSTYQAVSGAGAQALEELREQQKAIVAGKNPEKKILPHVIANNIFSHNSPMLDNGYNEEEMKMVKETRKIFHDDKIEVSPTCIRVPIERAHSESIHLILRDKVDLAAIKAALAKAPGLKIVDEPAKSYFPMPLDVSGEEDVLIGRIRPDLENPNALNLFLCGDQLLKGAALNAVQIAELLVK